MKNIILLFIITCTFWTCDEPEDVPSYIYIKPFELQLNNGIGTNKFVDAWVYVNGNPIGAYTVPGEVPIPSSGKTELIIYPGVRNNGFSGTPAIYFNCERFDASIDLKAGKTDTIYPKTRYAKNIVFAWNEDFESTNSLDTDVDDDKAFDFRVVNSGVKYGKNCGFFTVNEKNTLMAVTSKLPIQGLPSNQKVYLEVDYQGTGVLNVELVGNGLTKTVPLEFASFAPRNEWNKAYINFRFSDYSPKDYPSFSFIFSAKLPTDANGNYTRKEADLRIDNIRLTHQP